MAGKSVHKETRKKKVRTLKEKRADKSARIAEKSASSRIPPTGR